MVNRCGYLVKPLACLGEDDERQREHHGSSREPDPRRQVVHSESGPSTIIIADDHPLFRGALRLAVARLMPSSEVAEAGGLDELVTTLEGKRDVDLILLDLTMPGVQGFSGLLYLRAQFPEVPVVIVSAHDDPTVVRRAVEFGASGFIPKSLGTDAIG